MNSLRRMMASLSVRLAINSRSRKYFAAGTEYLPPTRSAEWLRLLQMQHALQTDYTLFDVLDRSRLAAQ
jgi:hypothetical protein